MNTTVVCREVRPAPGSGKRCVVVASRDERPGVEATTPPSLANLAGVRDRLRAQGIVLGGPLQPAQRAGALSRPASPVQIIAHDEHGREHRMVAEEVEEYSLSTGTTLYYFQVPEAPGDCNWLVGRTVRVAELGSRQPPSAEHVAAAAGGRAPGSS